MHMSGVNRTYNAGNTISQGFSMAEELNGYFSSVFTRQDISSLQVPDAKLLEAKSDYLGQSIVTAEVEPKLLMETVEQMSILFNLSLKEGVVPFEWKEANNKPLFKKGSRNKSENYRPVSLTSVICKLLERSIKDHIVDEGSPLYII